MKIFITGIAGFLGSPLASRMISLGHNVAGNDNLLGGDLENLDKRISFHQIDCNDFESMSKLELETFGRTIGIELDRRLSKNKLIKQLQEHIEYMETM